MLWLMVQVTCFSQPTPTRPLAWQSEIIQRYSRLRQTTRNLALKNNWPLYKNYSSRKQLVLQEIDPLGQPVYYTLHNTEAAQATRTQALHKSGSLNLSLSGSSSFMNGRMGLWDGGKALATHQEFVGSAGTSALKPMDNATVLNDHTTHLAGTLVARGINPRAQGMAYGASVSIWDYTDDITEITAAAPGLLLSNHAYGPVVGWVYNTSRPGTDPAQKWEWWGNTTISATEDYLFGFYTTKAQDIDRIAYNNPFYLMVRSADNKRAETGPPTGTPYFLKNTNTTSTLTRSRNDAYDVIPAEATAKNILTVGAADITYDNQNKPLTVSSAAFSGWGPTDDGRIKPDLLGLGTDIFSTLSTSSSAYGTYTGTSMASANVTGSLFLLQELYGQQRSVALGATSSLSSLFMRSATLRGLVLHTATRTNPAAGPDYRQGWGLLNTEAAAQVILNSNQAHLILEKTLDSGSTFNQPITAQGNEPLVVTLCWTDPEGAATVVAAASLNSRTPKLVNDLDIRLNDGKVTTYPFVLDPGNPAQAASKGDNSRDNVEQIYIANPRPGQVYTLSVSHKGKMTYAGQPFSVLVSGLYRSSCQFSVSITPAGSATLCAGAKLHLSAGNRAKVSYQWLLNNVPLEAATDSVYAITQAGTYALRLTDSNGCSSTSNTVQVQLKKAVVTLTPSADQWLCQDGRPIPVTVNNAAGSTVNWLRNGIPLPNQLSSTINVTEPGNYQARLTQQDCQFLSDTVIVQTTTVSNITLTPAETDLALLKGATVTLQAASGPDYQYQWYRNNEALAKANASQLSVSEPGVYKVQVTQQNCVGWSTERTVSLATLNNLVPEADTMFNAYPNPVESTISIQYAFPNAKTVQADVIDLLGRLQQPSMLLKAINRHFEDSLDVSTLTDGFYFLRLSDGNRIRIWRFLKK